MEARDTLFDVVEALERPALARVEDAVPDRVADARQQVELVHPQRERVGLGVDADEPLGVVLDDLCDRVLELGARGVREVVVRHLAKAVDRRPGLGGPDRDRVADPRVRVVGEFELVQPELFVPDRVRDRRLLVRRPVVVRSAVWQEVEHDRSALVGRGVTHDARYVEALLN